MFRLSRKLILLNVVSLLLVLPIAASSAPQLPHRLVVILLVDQLRPDLLTSDLPGGLGRMLREGRVFQDAVLDHAITETCPGHASIMSGRHPGRVGIPSNRFFDRKNQSTRYCVEDPKFGVIGSDERRSPRNLRGHTLGDWLHQQRPGSKVVSVAGKDRSAILMAGRTGDIAYWFDRQGIGFTSSRYYREALPQWVARFNGRSVEDGFIGELPYHWKHQKKFPLYGRADDFVGESEEFSRKYSHPLRAASRKQSLKQLYASPFLDLVTLQFATQLMQQESIGQDDIPDFLGISLSGFDVVGHRYGPFSHEAHDALLRVDQAVGEFLSYLDQEVGKNRYRIVLSADHGVMPLPEWLQEIGQAECPSGDGRVDPRALSKRILRRLSEELQRSAEGLFVWNGPQILIRPEAAESAGLSRRQLVAALKRVAKKEVVVRRLWTAQDWTRPDALPPFAALFRNSWDPERSGDLIVQFEAGCLLSPYPAGTGHGSAYDYDRKIPLIFFGGNIDPGLIRGSARSVDIAPTLAKGLRLHPPPNIDGRVLRLRHRFGARVPVQRKVGGGEF